MIFNCDQDRDPVTSSGIYSGLIPYLTICSLLAWMENRNQCSIWLHNLSISSTTFFNYFILYWMWSEIFRNIFWFRNLYPQTFSLPGGFRLSCWGLRWTQYYKTGITCCTDKRTLPCLTLILSPYYDRWGHPKAHRDGLIVNRSCWSLFILFHPPCLSVIVIFPSPDINLPLIP